MSSANVGRHRWGGLAELEKNDPVPDVGRCVERIGFRARQWRRWLERQSSSTSSSSAWLGESSAGLSWAAARYRFGWMISPPAVEAGGLRHFDG
ncbi:hypothetical protein XAC3810_780029 [Xanthomonas citri pv. citri]|uniref:Uncharacterized protein n=1 Tax=Xanthomonas citri pv. citri TaxID=611301 RepID=A0A0U5BZ77_XANCI|nr:hypothetical protein XAC902_1070223 [Xanthomonas citri pv. citri]CEE23544.1 hypothetical protein XAC908_1090185 [Xanthomonas citri pv. citri]CEE40960.1 hypothetical protein XAC9322_750029 [Xanthomonas citri pv. citri]CEE42413.1 hypothetical protein XAC1083_780028 [Xanthomonas citri pv. citri]CEE48325.1 hypothetical protein XAC3810_780029 [Xanthomonas citri pv. citri]